MEFRWSKQTKVNSEDGPSARCWHTFTAVGDTIYLFGGLGPEGPKNDVYKLSQSWGEFQWSKVETKGEVPSPRFRHTASAVGDDIFIIGGFTGPKTRLNDVWKLNVSTGEWTCTIPDSGPEGKASKNVPAPRGSHTADVVGTDIYVFGGYGGYGFCLIELGDMFVLDTTAMSWRTVTAKGMPSARSGHASCVHKGRIAIYGGLSSTGACEGVNWFDCEESSWKQTSIPGKGYPRYNHALLPVKGQFNSKIVAVMGSEPSTDDENARGVFSSRISVLDVGAHGMWANGEDASEEKNCNTFQNTSCF
jgi:N-acetylneuraminic acid mutarotase